MNSLLENLKTAYPSLKFTQGKTFCWSPETQEIFYNITDIKASKKELWSLLHETGHGLLKHQKYTYDIELLQMEMAAWAKARELAREFKITINEEHIQDCLDTYRDWLHARSLCPSCTTKCLQQEDPRQYRCHNCHTTWKVSPARFARPYRAVKNTQQQSVIFTANAL